MKHHVIASTADLGLTPQQAHALRCLDPGQPLPMRDLAGQLMCDASTVTGLVDRLEERALVERRPDPGDRRVKALVLTDAGIAARQRLIEVLTTGAPHRSSLDAAQRAQLRDLLRQIVDRDATYGAPAGALPGRRAPVDSGFGAAPPGFVDTLGPSGAKTGSPD
jgi:DNA-binding MarR family transcriptional regulator